MLPSARFILRLAAINIVGLELGRLSPQPPALRTTLASLFLIAIPVVAALLAGRRPRVHWLRDAVRDVVAGQALGWTLGLAIVGVVHGGLNSPAWLTAFAPVFLLACAGIALLVAPLGRFLTRSAQPAGPSSERAD
jgi:hypothetical protein